MITCVVTVLPWFCIHGRFIWTGLPSNTHAGIIQWKHFLKQTPTQVITNTLILSYINSWGATYWETMECLCPGGMLPSSLKYVTEGRWGFSRSCSTMSSMLFSWQKISILCWATTDSVPLSEVLPFPKPQSNSNWGKKTFHSYLEVDKNTCYHNYFLLQLFLWKDKVKLICHLFAH